MAEREPRPDAVRIGIEIEGIGSIRLNWSLNGTAQKDALVPTESRDDKFMAGMKQMKLIRSHSFSVSADAAAAAVARDQFAIPERGVYVSPEEVKAKDQRGLAHPGELISAPHQLNAAQLKNLRSSVRRALFSRGGAQQTWDRTAKTLTAYSGIDGAEISARWARGAMQRVGGSLQTTVGICAHKLLHDSADVRSAAATMMIKAGEELTNTKFLLGAAVAGQAVLSAAHDKLAAAADSQKQYGVRLALFMYLLHMCVHRLKKNAGQWEKTVYGASFKSYTSFHGCGAVDSEAENTVLKDLGADPKGALTAQLLATLGGLKGAPAWFLTSLKKDLNVDQIGAPDLSMQAQYEKAAVIPCFTNTGKLYTVVEARQKEAKLNQKMQEFLNTTDQLAPAAASAVYEALRGALV